MVLSRTLRLLQIRDGFHLPFSRYHQKKTKTTDRGCETKQQRQCPFFIVLSPLFRCHNESFYIANLVTTTFVVLMHNWILS